MEKWRDDATDGSSIRNCSPNLQKLVINIDQSNGIVSFEAIVKLLQELPQLHTFWYTTFVCDNSYGTDYQDGQIWEHLIRTYLPNLIDFRLNVGLEAKSDLCPENIIQPFCSHFWIEEKKWYFVADRPGNNADTIELYSLPPPAKAKIIFRTNTRWVSNSVNPNFRGITTLALLSTSYGWVDTKLENRHYTSVTTICPPDAFDSDYGCLMDLSEWSVSSSEIC
ncbi:unnamed protein product [Rotaria sp. Silwood1]|nr:unnamed protein product [Rotaria sp. Silwood1]